MKIGKMYSVGQSPKVVAHAVEWSRVLSLARLVHPGINVHFDHPHLNKHYRKIFCARDFKLFARDHNSYGFTYVMETNPTFELNVFMKINRNLTTPRIKIFSMLYILFKRP